jgi:ribonuclease P protein component
LISLRKKKDFETLFKEGISSNMSYLCLKFRQNGQETARVAVIVSVKTAHTAVNRNRLRRVIRGFLQKNHSRIRPGIDFAIIIKQSPTRKEIARLAELTEKLLEKNKIIKQKND